MEVKIPEIHCEKIEEFSEEGRKFLRYWGSFSCNKNNFSVFIPRLSLDFQGLELTGETIKENNEHFIFLASKRECFALTLEQDENEVFFQLERKEGACE